jgi:sialate O-acetylesterase
MNFLIKKVCLFVLISISTNAAFSNVRLPKLVGNHMVLQRNTRLPIWGWADKGEIVTLSFLGKSYSAKPGPDGKWMVTLPAIPAGGPYEMTIKGKNTLTIQDILVGDVWLGSGQSNMEWNLSMTVNNYKEEIAKADFPQIRLFDVKNVIAIIPQQEMTSEGWKLCNPENIGGFSAVAYFFGRDLHRQYQVPIGLITSDWGGTPAEAWTSAAALKTLPDLKPFVEKIEKGAGTVTKDAQEYEAKLAAWQKEFGSQDRGNLPNGKTWADLDVDTSTWPQMNLPAIWEQPGILPDFDGVVWFRKELILTEAEAGKPLYLHLTTIDDDDITWFNGVQVGNTNGYNVVRNYSVPAHLVKAGRNLITVRVTDSGGGGGIYGNEGELLAEVGGKTLSLAGKWSYQTAFDVRTLPKRPAAMLDQNSPTALFNAMIAPLIPYAIKGAIWYQGESNTSRAYQYRTLFPTMINDWRKRWGYDFPFLFVQLAGYMKDKDQPADYEWAELREAQTKTLSLPNTGMALTIDIGDPDDIHPRNKQDVGKRLALVARKVAYSDNQVVYSGPTFESMTVDGSRIRLKFSNLGSGLLVNDKYGYVRGFAVAGADKKFVWVKGYQDGNEIVLYSEPNTTPVAVRYNWGNSPDGNLYNKEGLPAVPFRTDNWKGITEKSSDF